MIPRFCQVVQVGDKHAVIVASRFASQPGISLREFDGSYAANEYAKSVNALARTYKDPRAQAAKESARG